MRGFTSPRKKTRGITLLSTLRKHLGCGKYTWTGWAVICLFLLFSAITVRLLILKRARQMNRLEPSAVAAREQFQIDESHTLSLLTGGSDTSNYFFLLVHGASREFQNAEHWLPHLQFFAQLGRVYAVDMLGHGASTPGGNDLSNHSVSALAQVRALQKLIAEKKRSHQQLVLVGRSYGGRIVLELANHLSDVHKIVLIAPALQQELVNGLREEVLSLPVLVFWAEDDTTVPYSRKKDTLDQFAAKEVVLFDHVLSEGQQAWEAHTPELIKVKEFQSKLRAWLVPA